VILGPRLEQQLQQGLQLSDGQVSGLFNEPVAIVVYAIVAVVLVWPLARRLVRRTPPAEVGFTAQEREKVEVR
jgi:putative tricarboxylic transport membrane protein